MKRRSLAKPAFSESGEASDAADQKGKGEGKQQQRSGGAASSASSGDEISASRLVSSGEEVTGRPRRPRKKERRRWDAVPMRYVVAREESSEVEKPQHRAPGISFISLNPSNWRKNSKLEAQQKKSSTGKSIPKEKSSTSHSTEKNVHEEESSSSHPKRKINLTGKIGTGDVKVSSGIVRRPNQEQQVKHSGGSSDQPASNHEGDVQVATEASLWRPNQEQQMKHSGGPCDQPASNSESDVPVAAEASAAPLSKVIGDGNTCDILKEGCLDDEKLLNRSRSVEAREEASFDEETSTWPRREDKKPKSSSGEPGSIVRDEDEHSGKNTFCGDLGKMVAQDEDGRHSEDIGGPAIEYHKQGRAGEHVQALLDMDDDTISEKISYYLDQLNFDPPDNCDYLPLPPYEPQKLTEVFEQLALYRIRAYLLAVGRQLAELDDENLRKHYSSTDFYEAGYFQYYEESLEWYFDPELCENPEFDDYQRLVLYNHGEYCDWDWYHLILNTFEKDMAYVQYCEALVNETKWIEDHLQHSTYEWDKVENVAKIQALQVAASFPSISPRLVLFAFDEYIWKILFDHSHYTEMDGVYFEIWKQVAKQKMDFREALLELHRENMFPLRTLDIEYELKDVPRRFYMKNDYNAYIAVIAETASDDEARQHIMEAIVEMSPKPKNYLDYIKEKVEIARDILLIGKLSMPCQSNIGAQVARD